MSFPFSCKFDQKFAGKNSSASYYLKFSLPMFLNFCLISASCSLLKKHEVAVRGRTIIEEA